jgi:hypothetical protein
MQLFGLEQKNAFSAFSRNLPAKYGFGVNVHEYVKDFYFSLNLSQKRQNLSDTFL